MANKPAKKIVLTEDEQYERLSSMMESVPCVISKKEQSRLYKGMAADFEAFGDLYDSAELSKECIRLSEETLQQYKNEKQKETKEEVEEEPKKTGKLKLIILILIILAVGAVFAYKYHGTRYYIAGIQKTIGMDKAAAKSYAVLGDYKDSVSKLNEANYDYAQDCAKAEKVDTARIYYRKAAKNGYKDSDKLLVQQEKLLLQDATVGHRTCFGSCKWIVLDKQGNKITLMQDKVMKNKSFADTKSETTWDKSSLRTFLNGEYLDIKFTDEEKKMLDTKSVEPGKNPTYGTDSGKTCMDKVSIFSTSTIKTFDITLQAKMKKETRKELKKKLNNIRLLTSGKDKFSTVFTSFNGTVIDYGFPVENDELGVRPIIEITI